MDVFEAIFTRQSVSKVKPDPLPREMVEKLLASGAQAPNHFRVRPWRFFVLEGAVRETLGEVVARSLRERLPDCGEAALNQERARFLRAPVVIAVGVDRPSEPKVLEIENVCAAAAAAQNILLAAHALGLGAMWRTGAAAANPDVKHFLGLEAGQHLIGFIYVGYPDIELPMPNRATYEDRTVWM